MPISQMGKLRLGEEEHQGLLTSLSDLVDQILSNRGLWWSKAGTILLIWLKPGYRNDREVGT